MKGVGRAVVRPECRFPAALDPGGAVDHLVGQVEPGGVVTAPHRERGPDRVPRRPGGASGVARLGAFDGSAAASVDGARPGAHEGSRDGAHDERLGCLPAPPVETVRAARAYLTPRYAVGADGFLWEAIELPLPDLECVGAVSSASDRARHGGGEEPGPMDVAAALVVLAAARLDIDRAEARLLEAAQDVAMGWEQIAAILGVSGVAAEERYRQLKPRLEESVADASPRRGGQRPGG